MVLKGHANDVTCLAVLRDGSLASGSCDETIKLWNKDGDCLKTLNGRAGPLLSLGISPEGSLVSLTQNKTADCPIRVWKDGVQTQTITGHGIKSCFAVLPDGTVATGSWQGRITLSNQEHRSTFAGHIAPVTCLAVLPDGSLASGSRDSTVKV